MRKNSCGCCVLEKCYKTRNPRGKASKAIIAQSLCFLCQIFFFFPYPFSKCFYWNSVFSLKILYLNFSFGPKLNFSSCSLLFIFFINVKWFALIGDSVLNSNALLRSAGSMPHSASTGELLLLTAPYSRL